MSLDLYLAYVLACAVLVIVPGPTVTLILANSLMYGTRAGFLNVVGTQFGLATMMAIVLVGLAWIIERMGFWFDWVRFLGAGYLIWLGLKLLFKPVRAVVGEPRPAPRGGFVLQGYLVLMSNPKVFLLFGAFIPQFVDPTTSYAGQVVLLGVTAMLVAAIFDSLYALAAGKAKTALSARALRLVSRMSGGILVAGGVWLALARPR